MDSPGRSRTYKRGIDEGLDGKNCRAFGDEEYEGHEKRKHKSSKSRKSGCGEDAAKCSGDRNDNRKRVGGSSKDYSDDDDYDMKKKSYSYSDKVKKKHEESTLERLSNWYGDRELETRHDSGDKSGGRGHGHTDESEKKISAKAVPTYADAQGSRGRSRSKDERSYNDENERAIDKDTRISYMRQSSKEKPHGSFEQGGNVVDDFDTVRNTDESNKTDPRSGKDIDPKHKIIRERSTSLLDISEGKIKVLDSSSEKAKSYSREERIDAKGSSMVREDIPVRERNDKFRENRGTGGDTLESRERSSNAEEDGTCVKDKSGREIGHSRRSRTPERSGRLRHDSHISEMENDRSCSLKRKDLDKEGYKEDRVKSIDDSWGDRNRDSDGSRENWKRKQHSGSDRDDADTTYNHDREWEVTRRCRDRMENERTVRSGSRKDVRGEVVKASSNFGISTENYDIIEIQRKPLDYGRDERESSFPRKNDVAQSELKSAPNDARNDWHRPAAHGSASAADGSKERYVDEGALLQDQGAWKDDADSQGGSVRGQRVTTSGRLNTARSSSSGSIPPYASQEPGGRASQPGVKGGRIGRTNRMRPPGRDNQQVNIPMHLMGPPFGPLAMPPPGPMQQLNPAMSPAPVPPIPPGVFIPPFSPPIWSSPRGLDMTLLPVSSGVSPLIPGLAGQRFGPDIGAPTNPLMFFNHPGSGRGVASNSSGSGFNAMVPAGRGPSYDKTCGVWVPPKSSGPPSKAPSRGEQNDYSQNFVDTGMRPQNFIRELELSNVEDYPKLRELIQKKDEIVAKVASPPMYFKCDLHEFVLSPEYFGTKFDVILVDPPWEEYVHRAPGVTDHMESWAFEEIMNLKIEAIADTPSFIFLWVGDGVGLEQGRQCLKKWGFRRCEDICWVKTNKHTASPALRHDSHTLFQHTKEHCLMGIKGTVRRSSDGHIIHANIDTDVIIAEEPPYGSTAKPDEIYKIIEHFALGRRRIELFGEDHNIRPGWLTVGKGLSSSNFNSEAYMRNFMDKDGKVWQGGGGRNPPPEAPHLVQTTPEIESLRPKSPMKNQQQLQQQSASIPLTSNSGNRKPAGNSPLIQEGPVDHHLSPWASMEGMRVPHDNVFDVYPYNIPPVLPSGEFFDFESQRTMNM